jgi:hypothetical protein
MDNCFAFAGTLKIYSHTPCGDEKLYRASLYLTRNFPKRDRRAIYVGNLTAIHNPPLSLSANSSLLDVGAFLHKKVIV